MNKNYIPNLFTFLNLSLGIISILFTLAGKTSYAALMVIAASIIDRYDGRIARKINASSSLGKELDSLSDLISFGAAPAILGFSLFLKHYGIIGYIITLIYPIAGAYRLARFNVTQFNSVYTGIPITVAGFIISVDYLISIYIGKHFGICSFISALLLILLSYLMVSNIKVKKR